MRRWLTIALALLFAVPLLPSLERSAWANSELHPGARLFFPLWDVSGPNRLTFIVVTREARRDNSSISSTQVGTLLTGVPTIITRFQVSGTPGNCIPRGVGGSSRNINRSDLGGTSANPVFVDDVHFEYYGKSCVKGDEIVHMSCADVDLFLLSSGGPRPGFDAVVGEGRGALDVHLIVNTSADPHSRKNTGAAQNTDTQSHDNSLMGNAIISDIAEGWATVYPAAAARTTTCSICAHIDGGTAMGYENYPMEVMLPFALVDGFPTTPPLRNILSLWGPGLLPADDLTNTNITIQFHWWDGRERRFNGSRGRHSIIAPLGNVAFGGLDPPLDSRFRVENFVCGHATTPDKAENDGFPRTGTDARDCGPTLGPPDTADPSDNFEVQSSTPISWWRFRLERDGQVPSAVATAIASAGACSNSSSSNVCANHSGRGLVGVVLSHTLGAITAGIGDSTRLWHKEPCRIASSQFTWGPPHVDNRQISQDENLLAIGFGLDNHDAVAIFNVLSFNTEHRLCQSDDTTDAP